MLSGTKLMQSRFGAVVVFSSLALSMLAAACGSSNPPPTGGANASIKNENNYTSSGTLTIPHVETQAGADLKVCWPAIEKDLLCHALSPVADIDSVTFLKIPNLTVEQIQTQFANGTFDQEVVKVFRSVRVDTLADGATCANLSQFKLGADMLKPADDYTVSASNKYMLLFANGVTPGVGSKTMLFLDPSASSTVTEVNAKTGCGILDFHADLSTPKPVSILAAGPYVIEWGSLTKDGLGNEVIFQDIDSLMVGYYEMTVAELEKQALDYNLIAKELYTVPVVDGARKLDLTTAKTAGGDSFSGFSGHTGGIWAVGLLCSQCQIPAPVAVAILSPN